MNSQQVLAPDQTTQISERQVFCLHRLIRLANVTEVLFDLAEVCDRVLLSRKNMSISVEDESHG